MIQEIMEIKTQKMEYLEKIQDLEAKLGLQAIQIKEHEKMLQSNENQIKMSQVPQQKDDSEDDTVTKEHIKSTLTMFLKKT